MPISMSRLVETGDTKPSSKDGNSGFMTWWKGGRDKKSSSQQPLPVNSDDDEENDDENDELENDEARYYSLEDTRKPKHTASQGPKSLTGPIREKDRLVDTSKGGRSKTKSCAGCKLDISQGMFREFMGVFFHPQCFCCRTCGQQIADHEPSLSEGGHPHHKSCYDASRPLTCDVCRQPLPTNRLGRSEYANGPFWSQKYCQRHDFDNTPRCWHCIRLQPWDATYISLADGRKVCPECKASSIMVIGECQLLYQDVKGFLGEMNMCLDRPVFVYLVDKNFLNQAMMQCGVLPTVLNIDYTFPRIADVIILLLYGAPRLMLGTRLIQQLTGLWLQLQGYLLPPELQLPTRWFVSYRWLEWRIKLMASSSNKGPECEAEMKLGEFVMYGFSNATCPTSRRAFHSIKIAVDKHGFHQTLKYITLYRCLPQ